MASEQNMTAITEESPISDPHTFDSFGRALTDAVIRAANNRLEAGEVDPSAEVIEFDIKVQLKRDSTAGERQKVGFCCLSYRLTAPDGKRYILSMGKCC